MTRWPEVPRIASALGATSLAYNVLQDQRLALVGVLVTFVLLVQFASFLADVEKRAPGVEAPSLTETFAVHWRRLVEVVVDFFLITGAFAVAYLLQFGWPGTTNRTRSWISSRRKSASGTAISSAWPKSWCGCVAPMMIRPSMTRLRWPCTTSLICSRTGRMRPGMQRSANCRCGTA